MNNIGALIEVAMREAILKINRSYNLINVPFSALMTDYINLRKNPATWTTQRSLGYMLASDFIFPRNDNAHRLFPFDRVKRPTFDSVYMVLKRDLCQFVPELFDLY